jgi:hypothetical protein
MQVRVFGKAAEYCDVCIVAGAEVALQPAMFNYDVKQGC